MCFICVEAAEVAATVTVMALPFRKRIWMYVRDMLGGKSDNRHKEEEAAPLGADDR